MYLNNSIAKRQKTAATPAPPVQVPNGSWAITPASPVQALGSTTKILNYDGSSGALERGYKPWGEVRFGPDDLPTGYQYTGQYRDKLIGLYYYGARWYDTTLGRFVQPDSIIVNSENPQSWDRYAYVINNPLKYIDPSGLYASEPLIDGLYSVEYAVNHANEIGECPPGQDPIKSLDDPGWRGWLVTTYSNNKPRLFLSSLQETEEIKSAIINIQIENLSLTSDMQVILNILGTAVDPLLKFITSIMKTGNSNNIHIGKIIIGTIVALIFGIMAYIAFIATAAAITNLQFELAAPSALIGGFCLFVAFIGLNIAYTGLGDKKPSSWPDDLFP